MTPRPAGDLFSHPDVHRPARPVPPQGDDGPLFQEPLPTPSDRPEGGRDDEV
ncbi:MULTISPECIES: hypothetical protein [unclassified Saccharothrix]|uniref:hypothetical protein n=1 Tax=unclassified Saccharothrix TaxID=2593673 RepID=UPI00307E433D